MNPFQPAGVAELGYGDFVKWEESKGEDRYRRGLYIHFQRTDALPSVGQFRRSPRRLCRSAARLRSNTPLQALNLLNDPVFLEAAQAFARRLSNEAPRISRAGLRYAYRLASTAIRHRPNTSGWQKFFEQQKTFSSRNPHR